ncbi:MAG: cysteine desulfurase family protein [Minisyncoccia bacterium]
MKIYLDYASTTPLDKRVFKFMKGYLFYDFGNPSSLHKLGREALKALDEARENIKNLIGADYPNEVIFTSSATESNNLAIKGAAFFYYFHLKHKPHIVASQIEHPSVIEVLKDLKKLGIAEYNLAKPEKTGEIKWDSILESIKENTILISIHYVNSEIGTIQNLRYISEKIKEINKTREPKIIFHTDAAQAPLTEDINIKNLGVDMMTLSSHKIYGPKGIACLYKKQDIILERILSGSEQENELRPGTESVPLIVGFSKALEFAVKEREKNRRYLSFIRDYFLKRLKDEGIKFEINGDIKISSPKILNLYFYDKLAEDILIYLDQNNVYISPGMACKARALEPSYIIEALYPFSDRNKKSIRFSFGKETKKREIDYLIKKLKNFFKNKTRLKRA